MAQLKTENIIPLSDLQRAPGKVVTKAIETKEPMVITQHGRPVVVMVDCKLYEELERNAKSLEQNNQISNQRESDLKTELDRLILQIVSRYEPERIILFGSLSKGNVSSSSDIDLIVIKKTKKKFWERQKELVKLVRPRLAADIFVYTPEEWDQFDNGQNDFFTSEIKTKGRVMYERAA